LGETLNKKEGVRNDKKVSILLSLILMNIFLNFNVAYTSNYSLKNDECSRNFNKRILEDMKESFPELKILHNKQEKGKDIVEGRETTHIKSLLPLFTGTSLGNRHLFIISVEEALPPKYDNSFVGYMVYKQTDGTNVMIKLRRSDTAWEVISKQKATGRRILPTKKCLEKLINET
jgi:hypothetical protein